MEKNTPDYGSRKEIYIPIDFDINILGPYFILRPT